MCLKPAPLFHLTLSTVVLSLKSQICHLNNEEEDALLPMGRGLCVGFVELPKATSLASYTHSTSRFLLSG